MNRGNELDEVLDLVEVERPVEVIKDKEQDREMVNLRYISLEVRHQ